MLSVSLLDDLRVKQEPLVIDRYWTIDLVDVIVQNIEVVVFHGIVEADHVIVTFT